MPAQKKLLVSLFVAMAIFLFSPKNLFAQNLLSNGGFESGEITPWVVYNVALASVTDEQFYGGSKSVKVVNTSTYSYGIQQLVTGIIEGKNYRFSGFVKNTDSYVAKVLLRIGWYKDGEQKGNNVDSEQITAISDWRELAVIGTAPSGVNSVKARAVLASITDNIPAFAYFDDLSFEEIEPPTPTPTPSPTPTSSPATGTYKINGIKNEKGEDLSSVKVYVDDKYTHHYASEILTFGDGRYCDDDKEIECGFGGHTIRLEKSGYEDWEKTIAVKPGFYDEDNPVMTHSQSSSSPTPTPTPSLTPTPTSTPTKKPTPTPTPTPSPSGEILSEATPSAEESEATPPAKQTFLPKILFGGGVLAILGMTISAFLITKRFKI